MGPRRSAAAAAVAVTPMGNRPVCRRNGVLAWAVSHGAVLLGVFTGALDPVAFWRDDGRCRRKYGEDWKEYCRRVRWRILPGVYGGRSRRRRPVVASHG